MGIRKKVIISILAILISACASHKEDEKTKFIEPEYKLYSLENGGTGIVVPSDKKSLSVGLTTRTNGFFTNMRDRVPTDEFEQICVARKKNTDQDIKLLNCMSETDNSSIVSQETTQEQRKYTKEKISQGIQKIFLEDGVKLDTFIFDLDGNKETKYTTRKMEKYDVPETYSVIRILWNKNEWSGKKMLLIKEN